MGLFAGSQNLAPEVCGQLMPAAQATSRVCLGPGVTNSVTGDTAVNGIGRPCPPGRERGAGALRGIGRGGSSVQHGKQVVVLCPAPWNCAQWAQFMPSTESLGSDSPPRQSARNPDTVPVLRPRVMAGGDKRRRAGVMAAALLAPLFLLSPARPASAHVRVFVGGAVGFPVYPYPYPYYYPYSAPYPEVPPPGWAPGQWEWRYDPWGRPYRTWVPPHLR